jgi:hypothetical protein
LFKYDVFVAKVMHDVPYLDTIYGGLCRLEFSEADHWSCAPVDLAQFDCWYGSKLRIIITFQNMPIAETTSVVPNGLLN